MSMSKAAMLLKKFNEAEGDNLDPSVDQQSTNQAVVDAPGATAQNDEQPSDQNPDSPSLQDLTQPEMIADALDDMADMADRYMDDQDTDCYTPDTEEAKNCVMEARGMMRRSGQMLRGLKKQG